MKSTLKLILASVTAFCILSVNGLNGQQKSESPKLKTVVVFEEKFDKLISQKLKESETTYDEKGNILEDIQYKEGKVDSHFKYQYDPNGNKIKETEFDPAGDVIEYSEYKYENNLRIEKIVYDARGKMKSRKNYVYTTF